MLVCLFFMKEGEIMSEKNLKGESDYERNIIEIVSNINFREKYKLKNEEKVKIKI